MELIRSVRSLGTVKHRCVVTIGNFDGVHTGHQAVIRQLKQAADESGLPAVVMTFEPLPLEYFSPGSAPTRLTDFRTKVELLGQLAVDKVLCLRFDKSLASLPAEVFIKDVLVDGLGMKKIIAGEDFRFGRNREGNLEMLHESAARYGFDVIAAATYDYNGLRVSSSLIRGHLALGDFSHASRLLGRSYQISGKVIHGDKRGKGLGFPTANIALKRSNIALSGVYAVRVHGLGEKARNGVASIGGTRPVSNGNRVLLETFIFDFDQQIYGTRISVEFLRHLRNEQDFPSVEALCEQMHKDAYKAREYLEKPEYNRKMEWNEQL